MTNPIEYTVEDSGAALHAAQHRGRAVERHSLGQKWCTCKKAKVESGRDRKRLDCVLMMSSWK